MHTRYQMFWSLLAQVWVSAAVQANDLGPLTDIPYTPGLDLTAIDREAQPCEDFYQYSCGGWLKNNPIPADSTRWSISAKVADNTFRYLWGSLNQLAENRKNLTGTQAQLGEFFSSCMNEPGIEKIGMAPLKVEWQEIDAMRSKKDLPEVLAKLHIKSDSYSIFFRFGSIQDLNNAQETIGFVDSGGIGLPDRDYYLSKSAEMKDIREKYQSYIRDMLQMTGVSAPQSAKDAKLILEMETALAQATLSRVQQRDLSNLNNKLNRKDLKKLTPDFNWDSYLKVLQISETQDLQLMDIKFVKALQKQWQTRSMTDIKTYLRWQVLGDRAMLLSRNFTERQFNFYAKELGGSPENPPRWKICIGAVNQHLGEALGKEYVERKFSPELKGNTQRMAQEIVKALAVEVSKLTWLSKESQVKALEKMKAVTLRIGYPDFWRDYSGLKMVGEDFYGNTVRAYTFDRQYQLRKIGRPNVQEDWMLSPQSVEAYYDPQRNSMNFPAAILQAPFYDSRMDAAVNFGNIGSTIGHELIHGFDDMGRQFDAKGNLKNWWSPADETAFNQKIQCIKDQYAQYPIIDSIKINSELTIGEDLADLAGTLLALRAWQKTIAEPGAPRDGFTPIQRFFLGSAQWACGHDRPEVQRANALTQAHSPRKYRVNGVLSNIPEFREAFSCKKGQAMVKDSVCRVW